MPTIYVEGSDVKQIEPVNGVIHVAGIIRSPMELIRIYWEVENPAGSGSTECEAWRGQHEIDCLTRAGYRITSIEKV